MSFAEGTLSRDREARCHCIASSSLRDLTSQPPSANVIIFMKGSTEWLRRVPLLRSSPVILVLER